MHTELETKVCTRCTVCKPVDQFHRGQCSCKICRSTAAKLRRSELRHDPHQIRRIAANNRRRNVRRQTYRRSRLVEGFKKATYSGSLEEYADWYEHRSLGWCSTSGWRKLLTPKRRSDRNCKQCGFRSGTTLYCSPRCRYRWNYHNVPSFRASERARRLRRKSELCDKVAMMLRGVLYGGKGGQRLPELIGCDAPTFVAHMIERMPAGLYVEDLQTSAVHIDHIVPRREFDLTDSEQWKRCWHFTNLRPMWRADNLRRSHK